MALNLNGVLGFQVDTKGLKTAQAELGKTLKDAKELADYLGNIKSPKVNAGSSSSGGSTTKQVADNASKAADKVALLARQLELVNQVFDKASAKSIAAFEKLSGGANKTTESFTRLTRELKAVDSGSGFSKLRSEIEKTAASAEKAASGPFGSLGKTLRGIFNFTLGFSVLNTINQSIKGFFNTAVALDRLAVSLKTATGSSLSAQQTFEELTARAAELGLPMLSLAKGFADFKIAAQGTALTSDQIKESFDGFAVAAAGSGLAAEQFDGVMRAVTQIMSKGTVQAEELRGQLGDRLPGAFSIAARSLGMTTAELDKALRAGAVSAEEFVTAFSTELKKLYKEAADARLNTIGGAFQDLKNSFTELAIAINQGGAGDALTALFQALAAGTRFITDNLDAIGSLVKALGLLGAAMTAAGLASYITSTRLALAAAAEVAAGTAAAAAVVPTTLLSRAFLTLQASMGWIGLLGAGAAALIYWIAKADPAETTAKKLASANKEYALSARLAADAASDFANTPLESKSKSELTKEIERLQTFRKESQANVSVINDSISKLEQQNNSFFTSSEEIEKNNKVITTLKAKIKAAAEDFHTNGLRIKDATNALRGFNDEAGRLRKVNASPETVDTEAYIAALYKGEKAVNDLKDAEEARANLNKKNLEYVGVFDDAYQRELKLIQDRRKAEKFFSDQQNATRQDEKDAAKDRKKEDKERFDALVDIMKLEEEERKILKGITKEEEDRVRNATALEGAATSNLSALKEQLALVEAGLSAEEAAYVIKLKQLNASNDLIGLESERVQKQIDAIQKARDEAKRVSDEINESLTDALLRGFESGKGFAKNFRDTLKNMFRTLVLKPLIEPILKPVSSVLGSLLTPSSGSGSNVDIGKSGPFGDISYTQKEATEFGKKAAAALGKGAQKLADFVGSDWAKSIASAFNSPENQAELESAFSTVGKVLGQAVQAYAKGAAIGSLLEGRGPFGKDTAKSAGTGAAVGRIGGTAIGAYFGNPELGGKIGEAVGTVVGVLAAGIKGRWKTKSNDVSISIVDGLFDATQTRVRKKKKLVGGGKKKTEIDELSAFDDQINAAFSVIEEAGTKIGLSFEGLSVTLKESIKGLDGEELEAKMLEIFNGVFQQVADFSLGADFDLSQFTQAGETLADTFARVVSETLVIRNAFSELGISTGRTGTALILFSQDLIELMGGFEIASSTLSSYASFTRTTAETTANLTSRLDSLTSSLGIASIRSAADLRAIIDPILALGDGATDAQRAILAALPELTQLASGIYETAEAANSAAIAMQKAAASFNANIDDQIAVISAGSGTLQADLAALDNEFKKLKEEATATGADLVKVEQLYALKKQEIINEYHQKELEAMQAQADKQAAIDKEKQEEIQRARQEALERERQAAEEAQRALEEARQAAIQFAQSIDDVRMSLGETLAGLRGGSGSLFNTNEILSQIAASTTAESVLALIGPLQQSIEAQYSEAVAAAEEARDAQIKVVEDTRDAAIESLEAQRDVIQEQIDNTNRLKDAARSLRDYIIGMTTDLGANSGSQAQGAAQNNFNRLVALATGGDEDALRELTSSADTLLDIGAQNATSYQELAKLRANVAETFSGLAGAFEALPSQESLLSDIDDQIAALNATAQSQIDAINAASESQINAITASFETNILALITAVNRLETAGSAASAAAVTAITNSLTSNITPLTNQAVTTNTNLVNGLINTTTGVRASLQTNNNTVGTTNSLLGTTNSSLGTVSSNVSSVNSGISTSNSNLNSIASDVDANLVTANSSNTKLSKLGWYNSKNIVTEALYRIYSAQGPMLLALDSIAEYTAAASGNVYNATNYPDYVGYIGGSGLGPVNAGGFAALPATPSALGNVFSGGLVPFADGGAFTNKIVNSPVGFDMGLMGEAGPEAIMPLTRMPNGSLGVEAQFGGNGMSEGLYAMSMQIASLSEEVRELRQANTAENAAIAGHTNKIQRVLTNAEDGDALAVRVVE